MSGTLSPARRAALTCAVLASIAIATSAAARAAGDTIVVNGTVLAPNAVAQVDQRTYVALRPEGEALENRPIRGP